MEEHIPGVSWYASDLHKHHNFIIVNSPEYVGKGVDHISIYAKFSRYLKTKILPSTNFNFLCFYVFYYTLTS